MLNYLGGGSPAGSECRHPHLRVWCRHAPVSCQQHSSPKRIRPSPPPVAVGAPGCWGSTGGLLPVESPVSVLSATWEESVSLSDWLSFPTSAVLPPEDSAMILDGSSTRTCCTCKVSCQTENLCVARLARA